MFVLFQINGSRNNDLLIKPQRRLSTFQYFISQYEKEFYKMVYTFDSTSGDSKRSRAQYK